MRTTVLFAALCLAVAGCTGIDSESTFKCKASEGVGCSSLTGVYDNALVDNLPGAPAKAKSTFNTEGEEKGKAIVGEPLKTGVPVLSEPVQLRIWVAPWEDDRKVLHDQSYLYLVADEGHWQIAHTKRIISTKYRVLAPIAKKESGKQEALPGQSQQSGQLPFQMPGAKPQQSEAGR